MRAQADSGPKFRELGDPHLTKVWLTCSLSQGISGGKQPILYEAKNGTLEGLHLAVSR